MNKFKPGDKVRKIKGRHQYTSYRFYDAKEELYLTVKDYSGIGSFFLALEDNHTFNPDDFELDIKSIHNDKYNTVLKGILNEEN